MAAAAKEGGDDDGAGAKNIDNSNVGAKDGDSDNEEDYTKGGKEGRGIEDGNDEDDKDDDEEDVMDILPPLVARRVERLKFINTERERVMERYMEERAALETKYLDICKPLYEERGNVVAGRLYDKIERIHKERGGKKEEDGSKGDDDGGNNGAGEGEKREGDASLEDASDNDYIYGAIASGKGTTTTNSKDNAKDDDEKEGRIMGIPQFWVCAMGHMEAAPKLITERDIDCLENLTNLNC